MTSLDSLLDRIEEQKKVEGLIPLSTNATSLDFLQAIYRDPNQPLQRRMRAAMAALPFEKPKFSAVAVMGKEDMADVLARALERSQKVINSRPMQVIEAPREISAGEIERADLPDHSAPFAHNNKSKFRRL